MKHAMLIPFFLLTLLPVSFSQYSSATDSDSEALGLMQKAGQTYTTSNIQLPFSIKYSYPGQEGTPVAGVLYQSGNSYRVDLDDYSIISDGKTRWVHLKKANEVNLYSEHKNGQDWLSPSDFLKLHTATDLVFVLAGKHTDGTSIIEAKPLKGRFDEYSKFTIAIKNGQLSSLKALSKDGTRQEIKLGTLSRPASFDNKKLFTFNASQFPGIHVEDLRLD
jgi:outer membrane lipoprotein-sorting protein